MCPIDLLINKIMKTKVESFEDIVFENRNKDYGAYELRRRYSKRAAVSLLISVFLLLSAVGGPFIASIMGKENYIGYNPIGIEGFKLEDLDSKDPVLAPPPPPPPAPKPNEIKFRALEFVDSLTNEEMELPTFDVLVDGSNSDLGDTSRIVAISISEPIIPEKEIYYDTYAIQEKPVFPGGERALINFVAAHTNYPVPAQEQGIEGTVYIRFVVTRTGKIGDVKVLRSADPLLDDEALKVVKLLPAWTPGKKNGYPVNVWFVIPVKFRLH